MKVEGNLLIVPIRHCCGPGLRDSLGLDFLFQLKQKNKFVVSLYYHLVVMVSILR